VPPPARARARKPAPRRRRRPTPIRRASPTDNLLRGAMVGGIVVTAIWLLFGTVP